MFEFICLKEILTATIRNECEEGFLNSVFSAKGRKRANKLAAASLELNEYKDEKII